MDGSGFTPDFSLGSPSWKGYHPEHLFIRLFAANMRYLKWMPVTFALVGCRESSTRAQFDYRAETTRKLGLMSLEVLEKIDSNEFIGDRYPERKLIKLSDFLGQENFEYTGGPLDFKDKLGNACMIRRIGAQWEIIAFGYNQKNEEGGGDDIVFPVELSGL